MKKRVVKRRKPALVSHHSSTGKRLAREHTSYPLIVFILLVMGLFMGALTRSAHAADVAINATVIGVPPTTPATIVTPVTGTHYTAVPVTVNGTCGPGDFIKLYRDGNFSGAVLCAGDGTFQVQTTLNDGANVLQARTFNGADLEGPTSPTVTVYYDAPVPPVTGGGNSGGSNGGSNGGTSGGQAPSSGGGSSGSGPPIFVTTDNPYKGYYTGDTVEWLLYASGGNGSYLFSVSWGDGTTSAVSVPKAGPFTISHMYKHAGTGYDDSYAIKITGADGLDAYTFLQLMVIVHDKNSIALMLNPDITSVAELPSLNIPLQLALIWPIYVVAMLMAVSFWLGQRRILLRLRPRGRPHHA